MAFDKAKELKHLDLLPACHLYLVFLEKEYNNGKDHLGAHYYMTAMGTVQAIEAENGHSNTYPA